MQLSPIGPNQTVVTAGSTQIFFSYSTPVAAFIPGRGYVKSSTKHSKTTTAHVNKWIAGSEAIEVEQSFLDTLPHCHDNAPL